MAGPGDRDCQPVEHMGRDGKAIERPCSRDCNRGKGGGVHAADKGLGTSGRGTGTSKLCAEAF